MAHGRASSNLAFGTIYTGALNRSTMGFRAFLLFIARYPVGLSGGECVSSADFKAIIPAGKVSNLGISRVLNWFFQAGQGKEFSHFPPHVHPFAEFIFKGIKEICVVVQKKLLCVA